MERSDFSSVYRMNPVFSPAPELSGLHYETERHLPVPVRRNGLPCLIFPSIEETGLVRHMVTARPGGVSKGYLSSLNLSFTRGDDPENVRENFRRVAKALEISQDAITFTYQTHTTHVRVVTEADRGKGLIRPYDYSDTDGLVTNVPDVCLAAFTADCVPVFFVDPVRKAIGLSHSGWRGTVGRISEKTVRLMEETFGTKPEDLVCAIGPSIGFSCYEVGDEVEEACKKAFPDAYRYGLLQERENGRYLFDLRKACQVTLEEAGVPKEQIAVSDLCTACNCDLLFSHRATGGKRGNFGSFLYLPR